jgi:hypothetical protein
MEVKYFKNGNINIRFDRDELADLKDLKAYRASCIENEVYCTLLDSIELDFLASDIETGCAGNYNIYYDLYNARTGFEYTPMDIDFVNAAEGKTLKLYARKITDVELKERYSNYYGED